MTDTGFSADNPTEIVITGKKKQPASASTIGKSAPLSASIQINGQPFPLTSFDIEGGAYGSVGHATITCSIAILAALGISVVALTTQNPGSTPLDIYVSDQQGQKVHLFGGEYINGVWDYDADNVTISARDWAGVLVDQKRALTKIVPGLPGAQDDPDAPGEDGTDTTGVSTVNVPIKTVVTNIANLFGLTPVFNLAPGETTVNIGTQYGGDADIILSNRPISLWAFLNILARDSGNEVYVDPDKNLVFGIPGANTPIPLLTLAYKLNPVPSGALPVRQPKVTHNVRRNASFRVLVLSYNPGQAQITQGEVYVLGDGVDASGNQTINPGVWSGNDAQLISKSLVGQDIKFPIYTFHIDGLTADQAQARATAIAADIAKREFIVSAVADMIPKVRPMNHTKLTGGIDKVFLGQDYYVNRFRHIYRMPRGPADREGGMITHLTLLNIKQQGIGSPLTAKAPTRVSGR